MEKKNILWDDAKSFQERLEYLIEELTLDEKIACMGTSCPDIPRLGISCFHLGGEGAHGVQARHDQGFDEVKVPDLTTGFSNPIGMSATWDQDLIRQAGKVVGTEARGLFSKRRRGSLCLWAPTVDMERDPRWGRTEEAYGEDPLLTGKMAGAYVEGIQGDDPKYLLAGTTLKHFYANNVEEGRVWKSSSLDLRNKWEYYLEPFRQVIQEHGAEGMMTAYNEINGIPAMLNDEVQRLAKDQWGLKHVVCDGGDVSQTVDFHHFYEEHSDTIAGGLAAGIDCFTDDPKMVQEATRKALADGKITEKDLDRALRCHFGTMFHLGLFDSEKSCSYHSITTKDVGKKKYHDLARQVAAESVVLLKNQDHILPLNKELFGPDNKLAVIGPQADAWYKDWYAGIPPYFVTPVQGVENQVSKDYILLENALDQVKIKLGHDQFLGLLSDGITVGAVNEAEAEVFEVEFWEENKVTLRLQKTGKLLTVEDDFAQGQSGHVTASKEEAYGWFVKECFDFEVIRNGENTDFPMIIKETKGYLRAWNQENLRLNEKQVLGVEPREDQVAERVGVAGTTDAFQAEEQSFGATLQVTLVPVKIGAQDAEKAAKEADFVLLMMGPNPVINCKEEIDRDTLELPSYQKKLIDRINKTNPNTVLVLISSVPYGLNEENRDLKGIINIAPGSMEMGNAIGDVVFGDVSPAGRLPMTWYRSVDDLPDMDDYDIIQGGRTYQYFEGEVLYPFGYGLSYSQFAYEDLQVTSGDEEIYISCSVKNAGDVTADEVVQIYGAKLDSARKRPLRQLMDFARVKALKPGEAREVHFQIPWDRLRYFDMVQDRMLLEPGSYRVEIGGSSQDIYGTQVLTISGEDRGVREAGKFVLMDHYDQYENAFLHRGPECQCVVRPEDEMEWMILTYQDVECKEEQQVFIDFWADGFYEIVLFADDDMVGMTMGKGEINLMEAAILEKLTKGVHEFRFQVRGEVKLWRFVVK